MFFAAKVYIIVFGGVFFLLNILGVNIFYKVFCETVVCNGFLFIFALCFFSRLYYDVV